MQLKNIAIVLISGLVFAGCSLLPGSKTEEAPETTNVIEETQVEDAMVKDDVMEKEDVVIKNAEQPQLNASNFTFGVDKISAKVGEELVVKVTNDSGVHDFVIDELGVSSGVIAQGDTMEITIPTDKPGTYEYYCSIGKHRALGMVGTITIE